MGKCGHATPRKITAKQPAEIGCLPHESIDSEPLQSVVDKEYDESKTNKQRISASITPKSWMILLDGHH